MMNYLKDSLYKSTCIFVHDQLQAPVCKCNNWNTYQETQLYLLCNSM